MAWPSARRLDASLSAMSECRSKLSKWLIRSFVKYGRVIERWNLFGLVGTPFWNTKDVLPHITCISCEILQVCEGAEEILTIRVEDPSSKEGVELRFHYRPCSNELETHSKITSRNLAFIER